MKNHSYTQTTNPVNGSECDECNRSIPSAGTACPLAALRIAHICPLCSFFAPVQPDASPPSVYKSVVLITLVELITAGCGQSEKPSPVHADQAVCYRSHNSVCG